jgi:hypothetical protein
VGAPEFLICGGLPFFLRPFNATFVNSKDFSTMNSTTIAADVVSYLLTGFGRLFYVVSPTATSFSTLQEVPDYIAESIPFFVITIVMEFMTLLLSNNGKSLEKKRSWEASRFSINDAVGSIGVRNHNFLRTLPGKFRLGLDILTNAITGRNASASI